MVSMKVINYLKFWGPNLSSLSNERLMKLVKDKADEEAFRRLYEEFHRPIYFYVKGLVKKVQIAEEITHEVFYKVWNKRETYKEGSSFKSWLWRIARNTSYDSLKKKRESSLEDFEAWEEVTMSDDKGPLEEILEKAQKDIVQKSLLKLPLKQRETLVLWSQGFTTQEMAKQLDVSEQVIKNRIFRSKTKLAELLKEEVDHEK